MPQLIERDAKKISPEQATALVRVIDLQAKWDGLLAEKELQTSGLHARQRANDAYQAAVRDYKTKYPKAEIPEPTHATPSGWWCGSVSCGSCLERPRAAAPSR